jgi:hypothetical protein
MDIIFYSYTIYYQTNVKTHARLFEYIVEKCSEINLLFIPLKIVSYFEESIRIHIGAKITHTALQYLFNFKSTFKF